MLVDKWGCTALFRGLLAKALTTGSLAVSGLLRLVTAAVTSSIALAKPDINGATLSIAAWILSYAVEMAVSTWRLRKLGWYVERRMETFYWASGNLDEAAAQRVQIIRHVASAGRR